MKIIFTILLSKINYLGCDIVLSPDFYKFYQNLNKATETL